MKRFSVRTPRDVQDEMTAQMIYIAEDSVDHAFAWEGRLMATFAGLADVVSYATDEAASERLGYTLHKLVFEGTYLIHYTVDEAAGVVRVVNFRHDARMPSRGEP